MNEEVAQCRNCHMTLKGKPYYMGGDAYHPKTNKKVPVNFYGGFVCSSDCDYRASIKMESSFPGAGEAEFLSSQAISKYRNNWKK